MDLAHKAQEDYSNIVNGETHTQAHIHTEYIHICIYTTSQKFLNSKIFYVFLKKTFLLTKPAFIWYNIQQKQWYCEIVLLFKITGFYLNIF